MSVNIALRLTDLRKEKGISQKEAASYLDVSQALLSHYEKGIRECGLDFLRKACDYYDVTADYLLGLTDNRHGLNDIYTKGTLDSDFDLKIKTLFRTMVSLSEKLSAAGDSEENRLKVEIMLSVYRFALLSSKYGITDSEWFSIDINEADRLSALILDNMFSFRRTSDKQSQNSFTSEPEYLKTLINGAEKYIRERYSEILNA